MTTRRDVPGPARQTSGEVAAFLAEARAHAPGSGRLVFALDATLSRQPAWDLACDLQAAMFDAVEGHRLTVQLVYYRDAGEARDATSSIT